MAFSPTASSGFPQQARKHHLSIAWTLQPKRPWLPLTVSIPGDGSVTGQVFNSFNDISFKDYRMTPGIGFRGIVRPNVVGRIDYGYSKEGGAIFAGLDFPY